MRGQLDCPGNSTGRSNELLRGRQEPSEQETYGAVTVTDGPRGPSPPHCPSDLDWHPRSVCPLMLTWGGRVVGRRSTMQPVEQLKAMCSCRRLSQYELHTHIKKPKTHLSVLWKVRLSLLKMQHL